MMMSFSMGVEELDDAKSVGGLTISLTEPMGVFPAPPSPIPPAVPPSLSARNKCPAAAALLRPRLLPDINVLLP